MDYHIARDGQQFGPVTEEQLRTGLADGTYLSTDLVWAEGMSDWKPVSEIVGAPASRIAPNPLSAPVRGPTAASMPNGELAQGAKASLILGILGVTCFSILTGIPAIILGHKARGLIKKSGNTLGGNGMALTGLILGYFSFVSIFIVAILAALAIPTFAKVQEKGLQVKAMNNARQIAVACKIYAADNNGRYPANLDVLVDQGLISDQHVLSCPVLVNGQDQGWDYLGAKLSDSEAGDLILLVSRWHDAQGRHIVTHNDTSVSLETPNPTKVRE